MESLVPLLLFAGLVAPPPIAPLGKVTHANCRGYRRESAWIQGNASMASAVSVYAMESDV